MDDMLQVLDSSYRNKWCQHQYLIHPKQHQMYHLLAPSFFRWELCWLNCRSIFSVWNLLLLYDATDKGCWESSVCFSECFLRFIYSPSDLTLLVVAFIFSFSFLDNVIVMSFKYEVPASSFILYAWETFGSAMGNFEFARDVKISIPDPNVSLYRISTSFVYHLIDLHILWVSNLCGKTIWIG